MKTYIFNGYKNISGNSIKEVRQKMKLLQADLAKQMQVKRIIIERDSVSQMAIGTKFVPDYELPVLSSVLNISIDWILRISDSSISETNKV